MNFCINCGHKDISQDVINSLIVDVLYNERLIKMDALNAIIAGISFFDTDVRNIYNKIKSEDKTINIIFVNSKLVYGFDHLLGILKIINEEEKRKIKSNIKSVEIEFLLRICYTNQIKDALKSNFGDNKNKTFVVVLISKLGTKLSYTLDALMSYGIEDSNLIHTDITKKDYIFNHFFKDKFKVNSYLLLNNEEKYLKFLIEKAAISLN
ncbi:KEOPS complex subunit Cgi121 [Candidatus Nitrosocosmicus sp. R]